MSRIKDLLMFANPADFRRAVRNPKKASKVFKNIVLQSSSSVDRVSNPEKKVRKAVEELFSCPEETVDEYFLQAEKSAEENIDPKLAEFSDLSFEPGGMSLGGVVLYSIIRILQPKDILEIGVANGMSTAYTLNALNDSHIRPEEINIHGIDMPQFEHIVRERRGRFGVEGRGGIVPSSKEVCWLTASENRQEYNYQLHIGDFTEILPDICDLYDSIDLVIYDASKNSDEMTFAYERCLSELSDKGVIISDDVLVNDSFQETVSGYKGKYQIINDTGIYIKQ